MRSKPDPSHPLHNPRHESFLQALLRGESQDAAYASAGYKPSRHSAARLTTNDNIRARLAYLRSQVASIVVEKTGITIADIVAELAKLGFSNMRDYVTIAEDGQVQVDVAPAPEGKWAAIQEFTSETYTEGKGADARLVTRTRIKLHGKESALVSIGKHLGMFDKDRDKGSDADAPEVPKAPSAERLEEMRRRYMPKSKRHLHVIEGGKEE